MKKAALFLFLFSLTLLAKADPARLLENNKDAFQVRADIIARAQHYITAEYYSVGSDQIALSTLALLRDAARRGVDVRLLVDAVSHRMSPAIMSVLKEEPHFHIKVFNAPGILNPNNWLRRLHDKAICVDTEVCVMGGRNITNSYFMRKNRQVDYTDLDIVFGGNAVIMAQNYFYQIWNGPSATEPVLRLYEPSEIGAPCTPSESDECIRSRDRIEREITQARSDLLIRSEKTHYFQNFIMPNPQNDWLADSELGTSITFLSDPIEAEKSEDGISADIFKIITENAKKSVLVISPYVVLSDRALGMFTQLRKNNIRVQIVTNSLNSTDHSSSQAMYQSSKKALIDIGAEIYEYKGPDTLHAKGVVVDREIIIVGSYNFDILSDRKNREIAITTKNPFLAVEMMSIIERFQQNSYKIGKDYNPINNDGNYQKVPPMKELTFKFSHLLNPFIEAMKR
jgi:putative cardiolipin synthase